MYDRSLLTPARDAWLAAWNAAKNETGAAQKSVADRAISELLLLNTKLGDVALVKQQLAEIKGRKMIGSDERTVDSARRSVGWMTNHEDVSFKCGPFAIDSILNIGKPVQHRNPLTEKFPSTSRGTNLSQLIDLADQVGLKYQAAKREPGADLVFPCVMHMKLDHFAAIVGKEGGKYRVKDTTFEPEGNRLVSGKVIDAESDGYFLVPEGTLPAGWSHVDKQDAASIWGKGGTVDIWNAYVPLLQALISDMSGGGGGTCPAGMAHLSASTMQATPNNH